MSKVYISRDKAIEAIEREFGDEASPDCIRAKEAVYSVKLADVIPVVHAHWIEAEQEGIIICSNCGHREFKIETRPGFCCRRCTAKMDEEIE